MLITNPRKGGLFVKIYTKYLILLPILFLFSGCASVRFVTVEKGCVVTQNHEAVSIIGNPRFTCYKEGNLIADGYFVQYNSNGTILIDDFGYGYISVDSASCQINSNADVQQEE